MAGVIAAVCNTASQENAEEAEQELRNKDAKLLAADEKVTLAFRNRGGKGRDSFVFTTTRILVVDVQGVTGKNVLYRSYPYSSVQAFVATTAGGIDADSDVVVHARGCGPLSLSFQKGKVDIYGVMTFLSAAVCGNEKLINTSGVTYSGPSGGASEGKVSQLVGYLGGDAAQLDPRIVEQQFRDTVGVLLPGETVELAFKCGRDTTVLTNMRFLQVDVQGMTGKQVAYLTLLWSSVSAFAVESAGGWLDRDATMILYTNIPLLKCIAQDLRKSTADVMSIQRFFSDKLLGAETMGAPAPIPDRMYGVADQSNMAADFFTGDSRQIDAAAANHKFHTNPPILQNCETVEMAFKCGRDLTLFTTKRFITIDVRGLSGKRCLYQSIPWATVKCFAISTAGTLDRDAELKLWTDIYFDPPPPGSDEPHPEPGMSFLMEDFHQSRCDLTMMLRCISARVLKLPSGLPLCPSGNPLSPELLRPTPSEQVSNISAVASWFTNDNFEVDPVSVNERFHNGVAFMLPNEFVVKAYLAGRDMNVFTNMRVMIVDKKGLSGKRVEYRSFPYSSIRSFSMRTGGSWDLDAEVTMDLCNHWDMSTVNIDLRKGKSDPVALNNFLASYVIGDCNSGAGGGPVFHPTGGSLSPPGAFLTWLEGNSYEIPASEVERQFQTSPPLLLPDERVRLALKSGRDMAVLTTKRFLNVDVQGLTGKRVEYTSYPISSIGGFAVETAGTLSRDSEIYIYMHVFYARMLQAKKVTITVAKKKCDVFAAQQALHELGRSVRRATNPAAGGWNAQPPAAGGWNAPPPAAGGWNAPPPAAGGWNAPPPAAGGWSAPPPAGDLGPSV